MDQNQLAMMNAYYQQQMQMMGPQSAMLMQQMSM